MNLFRSEEHVRRWELYSQASEDYILPVATWAEIFSGPLFTQRLAPDYLERGEEYVEAYHDALREAGKASPYWQYPLIAAMDEVRLSRYQVVGAYTRYETRVLNDLKDARVRIVAGLEPPVLCLIDEADAHAGEPWPYEVLMPHLDVNLGVGHVAFVLAGSSGFSLEGMKQRIGGRPKGSDVLSRIPVSNQFVIPAMSFGDRVLITLRQFVEAGRRLGHEIGQVEKLGLYYVAVNGRLANARQLQEFAARTVERIPRGDDRIKYDHLFVPGDPENKRFWMEVGGVARDLVNSFVTIEG